MKVGAHDGPAPLGHMWLRAHFGLRAPAPHVESYVIAGARRTETNGSDIIELYPRAYATGDDVVANLRFALRYEPLDLGTLSAAFAAISADTIADWVRREPSGSYARRAWFLYGI